MKNLAGVYIAVENPLYRGESKIKLTKEAQQNLEKESLDKLDRLKVLAIGEAVESIKVGDEIFVDLNRLANAPRTVVDNVGYIFLRESDRIFTY